MRKDVFSDSLASAKLSRPEQTLTRRLDEKKPPSDIPMSRKPFTLSRILALGLRSFLKEPNTEFGMFPLEVSASGGCGGSVVAGRGWEGLNTACSKSPNAYASTSETFSLSRNLQLDITR